MSVTKPKALDLLYFLYVHCKYSLNRLPSLKIHLWATILKFELFDLGFHCHSFYLLHFHLQSILLPEFLYPFEFGTPSSRFHFHLWVIFQMFHFHLFLIISIISLSLSSLDRSFNHFHFPEHPLLRGLSVPLLREPLQALLLLLCESLKSSESSAPK